MNTLKYNEISDIEKTGNTFSDSSFRREIQKLYKPFKVSHKNDSIADIIMPSSGCLIIESRNGKNDTNIISSIIHGDEIGPLEELNKLVDDILTGRIIVNENIAILLGNLPMMGYKRGGDGVMGNLNRLFNQGDWINPINYEQRRANLLMNYVLESISGNGETCHIDLHQSFEVPKTSQVRSLSHKEYPYIDQYNFVMGYPLGNNKNAYLQWIRENLSNVLAGVVLNDMSDPSIYKTFAGFSASNGVISGTYEMGKIGTTQNAYIAELFNYIRSRLYGMGKLSNCNQQKIDIWETSNKSYQKTSDDFTFLDENKNPVDFMPVNKEIAIQNGETINITNYGRVLFANSSVPVGDRPFVEINPMYYEKYTNDWMKKNI
jgi:succinylglutamate desuccinylase